MNEARYISSLHRLALFTAAATFPLIFMGGLVTSHKAGMSVPDWPNSYGYNMFLFPPRLWIGGILYEHTHRLMGTVVGMLSIALVVCAWVTKARPSVRWLSAAVLAAVIFQGVLGGLRVVLVKLDLAVVHGCFAQAFFCLTALVAVVTSRWWIEAPDLSSEGDYRLTRLALAATAVIYLQLVAGALMRHYDAGLAIPDLPLAYGHVLPPTSPEELAKINTQRTWQLNLDRVTLGQVWLHFAHRLGAILVTAALTTLIVQVLRRHRRGALVRPAVALIILLLAQITLGVLTVLLRKPADVATLHVATGALVLVTTFTLTVRTWRLYRPRRRHVDYAIEEGPVLPYEPVAV